MEPHALFACEVDMRKVILLIWHEIEARAVLMWTPIFADRLAAVVIRCSRRASENDHLMNGIVSPWFRTGALWSGFAHR